MIEPKIIQYKDELNDEFSEAKIEPRRIDENYKYTHKFLWNTCSWIVKNILSMPIKIGYLKLKFKHKYIGKEKLKKYKKQGYFIYGNHTQPFADTFIPTVPMWPKNHYLIVNPENVSIKGMKTINEMLGAIPIPCNRQGMKNFLAKIKDCSQNRNAAIVIYPEAHIWPYYTKIRPFKAVSFKYPVEYDVPAFCITNTYQSYGKNKDKVKMVSYIDGPFYANKELSNKEAQHDLRNQVYDMMCERCKNSNIEVIKYKKMTLGTEEKVIIKK